MKKLILLGVAFLIVFQKSFAIGNPAAENCLEKKGKLVSILRTDGEDGLCQFGPEKFAGTIEQWTLFRYSPDNSHDQLVLQKFFSLSTLENEELTPKVARYRCVKAGGKISLAKEINGDGVVIGKVTMCKFSDRSEMELFSFAYGSKSSKNADLVRALESQTN